MIVFDLKCANDHVFEAWFNSSSAYDQQRGQGLLMCPTCGISDVAKAVMAPNVGSKGNQLTVTVPVPQPQATTPVAMPADPARAEVAQLFAKIAALQAEAIKSSTWVGKGFAETARAMDAGTVDVAPIHGQATPEEAKALAEDGIGVMPLLIPVVPPEERN